MSCAKPVLIALAIAFASAACGEPQEPADSTSDSAEQSGSMRVGAPAYIGTFVADTGVVGELSQLVLKTDLSFHSTRVVVCVTRPCNPVPQDGEYRVSTLDGRNYITLYRADQVIDRYEYQIQADTLMLLRSATNAAEGAGGCGWVSMHRTTAAWCAASSDCALQNLPIGPCAGEYICSGSSVCNWSCAAQM
jgi:hypothetical protein